MSDDLDPRLSARLDRELDQVVQPRQWRLRTPRPARLGGTAVVAATLLVAIIGLVAGSVLRDLRGIRPPEPGVGSGPVASAPTPPGPRFPAHTAAEVLSGIEGDPFVTPAWPASSLGI